MNKKTEKVKENKLPDKNQEAISSLGIQITEQRKQVEYHNVMMLKKKGALEILTELYPEKETSES